MSDQAASTVAGATVHAVTSSHRPDEKASVSRPSDGEMSKTRSTKDEKKTNESKNNEEKKVDRQKGGTKKTDTGQGISQGGGQNRRNRYYNDRPRYQRGTRADVRTDSRRGDQERQYRNPGHRPDLKSDNPPLSSQSYNKDDDKKSVHPQDQPKAAGQSRSKASISKTERPQSGETQKNARPPPRHKQDGGQYRNPRQHGRQGGRAKSPIRAEKKTVLTKDNTSDKIEIDDSKTLKSTTAVKETLNVEASSETSKPPEKPPPQSKSTAKNSDRYNYTKSKPEKQQTREKGRHRGQRSIPTVQSDQLAQELTAGTYECMVCCECVRGKHQVWSCEGCYHVFHLKCIKKWASAPVLGIDEGTPEGWQCPSCRRCSTIVPTVYRCFCGRVTNPWQRNRGELSVPHSCGDTCLKSLAVGPHSSCRHKCRLPCHPGPCPPCPVMVTRTCPCGKISHQVRCSRTGDLPLCGSVCGRGLACGRHSCEDNCHSGPCRGCEEVLTQQCHCGRQTRQSCCGEEKSQMFSCGQVCNKELDCGNHLCELLCHEGACPSCPLLPSAITTCPCGATPISQLLSEGRGRVSCFDPVPTCDSVCGKILPCSIADDPHLCPAPCHSGVCASCDKTSVVTCLCGASSSSVPCVEVVDGKWVEFRCERVCNKKKSCGRHRCNTRCCVDTEHKCELLCSKKLQCGLHHCQETCHRGHCQQCWEYSYTELTCHCGGEVLHPPIPCGTLPPPCTRLCARMHSCGHPVRHGCHYDEFCPPCTSLVEKMCMGGHELRRNLPCHLTDVSCGAACGCPLQCGRHKCQRTCHRGNCDELPCQQPCTTKRRLCDHECGEPCHVGRECPDTPCRTFIELQCGCGRKKERSVCMASESGAMRQAFQMFSKDLASSGETISISAITGTNQKRSKSLECDEVCRQVQRNKELAMALDIERPIVDPLESGNSGEGLQYSPYLLEEARNNLEFVTEVEEALRQLVESAFKGPPSKIHKHLFRPMKSNHRKIIHELSVHYGCETTSYDSEPIRNVTASATKSAVKLPSLSLTKLIERERFKPPPAPLHVMTVAGKADTTQLANLGNQSTTEITDYFADDLKL